MWTMRSQPDDPRASIHGGVTLWRRIADDFEQAISTGAYRTGDRLPPETEIAGRFGVNRHTVRRALAALAERGLVRAEQGSGTFVEMRRLAYPIGSRTRFSEIVGTAGHEAGGRLLGHATEPASHDVADRLAVTPGSDVIRLDILRSADRVPVCHAASWLPAARMPDAVRVYRATRSMTKTLAHYGIRDYRRQTTRVTAAIGDAVDAERLRLTPGRPLLVVESVDVDATGAPVVTTQSRFAADRVTLLVGG
jgi:GntR family transcriptional regulator, phosphonate transport system regulatory protein